MAREITAQELKQRLEDGDELLLVDLMPPSQYLLLHLPGAISIPLDYLHEVIAYLPQDRDIILYCTNRECEFSHVAARKLELHGFTNVVILPGGLQEWEKAGYPFATVLLSPVEDGEEGARKAEEQTAPATPAGVGASAT